MIWHIDENCFKDWSQSNLSFASSNIKEKLFNDHPLIEHLSEKLVHVFVSIEMRGQSVDSELKYNYRKSVHRVLQYILDIPQHRKAMKVCFITMTVYIALGLATYGNNSYFWKYLWWFSLEASHWDTTNENP